MSVACYGFTGEGGVEVDVGCVEEIELCLLVQVENWMDCDATCDISSRKSWLHRVTECFQWPPRYRTLMRRRAICHCWTVLGCSGNILDVEDGRGLLPLSGVMFAGDLLHFIYICANRQLRQCSSRQILLNYQ